MVVHARTRDEFYRPPAHWPWVARIRAAVPIPVIANGEVWTLEDYLRCRAVSGCADVMLGRGAVADPFLARRIKAHLAGRAATDGPVADWPAVKPLLAQYWRRLPEKVRACHAPGRLKMWLKVLGRTFPPAAALYRTVRALPSGEAVERVLREYDLV